LAYLHQDFKSNKLTQFNKIFLKCQPF